MTEEEAKKAKHINYFTRLRFNEKYNFIVKVLNKYVKSNNNLEIEKLQKQIQDMPLHIHLIHCTQMNLIQKHHQKALEVSRLVQVKVSQMNCQTLLYK